MNTIPTALIMAIVGMILLGYATGIVTTLKVHPVWCVPVTLFVLLPAVFLGGLIAFKYR